MGLWPAHDAALNGAVSVDGEGHECLPSPAAPRCRMVQVAPMKNFPPLSSITEESLISMNTSFPQPPPDWAVSLAPVWRSSLEIDERVHEDADHQPGVQDDVIPDAEGGTGE
jgi:hypothetical protein